MHIADLQTLRRSRGIAAFQWMRVVIVLALAGAGVFAVSLTAEDRNVPSDVTATADAHETTNITKVLEPLAPAQIASVEPNVADLAVDHAMDSGSSAASVPEAESTGIPDDTRQADAVAPPADWGGDAPLHEAKQAFVNEPLPPAAPEMTGAVNAASDADNSPSSNALVDLNRASFEQLNALKGAGPLGRAIIKGRPYASVGDLVTRKVIRRTIYERIKDQVTVR